MPRISLRPVCALTCSLLVTVSPVYALTVEELAEQLEAFKKQQTEDQQEIKRLRDRLQRLEQGTPATREGNAGGKFGYTRDNGQNKGEVTETTTVVPVEDLSERLTTLEERIDEELRRSSNSISTIQGYYHKNRNRYRFNGFLSAGLSTLSTDTNDSNVDYFNVTDDVRGQADTTLGLQINFEINDSTQGVGQIIGYAGREFDARMEWAFIRHQYSDNLVIRAGRMRTPFFMMSEYLEVGYAYPWVRPPMEVYALGINDYDGVDFLYSFSAFDIDSTIEVYGGSHKSTDDVESATVQELEVNKVLGMRYTAVWNDLTVTFGYGKGELDAELGDAVQPFNDTLGILLGEEEPILPEDAEGNFSGIGCIYDNGDWMLIGEAVRRRIEGLFLNECANYLTVSRRFGAWQPYVTYARQFVTDSKERRELDARFGLSGDLSFTEQLNFEQRSLTYGVRFDVMPNVALKFEYQHASDITSTGLFTDRGLHAVFFGTEAVEPYQRHHLGAIATRSRETAIV